ncbi:MAG TPA: hypothetical protein VGQ57_13000, partial [Polyangiaceae bacterium]|nr:hypothetical protein [Polyangiaceae bacterium]
MPFHAELTKAKAPAPRAQTFLAPSKTPGMAPKLVTVKLPPQKLETTWGIAVASYLGNSQSPVWAFGAERFRARYMPKPKLVPPPRRGKAPAVIAPPQHYELANLMDTTTGRLSVQFALEQERELYVADARLKPDIPLASVNAPRLAHHPWGDMLSKLGATPPDEPLARAVPAEFYYVRARDFAKLMTLLDVLDDFGEPAANVLDARTEVRGSLVRYEEELGLARTALTRALGPAIVSELAVAGSDPYVHEGSDITLLFRVKDVGLFDSALSGTLARYAALHPGVTESTFNADGVTVTSRRSADGRVRQQRATLGDLTVVSNSEAAIRRVIGAAQGKRPSLAAEPDFRYMLARDRDTPNDVLAYLGDRFVASVVGPAQKIGEARRQLALGELVTPGYAALTLGLIDGRSPASTKDVLGSGLLAPGELKHGDGSPIDWEPGRGARSVWGTPAALEPLIDRPEVGSVTLPEKTGYEQFARGYEMEWSDRIDPIALRIAVDRAAAGVQPLSFDLRVLPMLRNEQWETIRTVGDVHLAVPALVPGLAGVIGLGEAASLREELSNSAGFFGLGERVKFDWLGDFAMLGTTSRNELANLLHPFVAEELELPRENRPRIGLELARAARNLPLYAAIGLKSRLGAGIFLTALRKMAHEAAPGMAEWSDAKPYRGNDVVAVTANEHGVDITLYYTLLKDALVLSLNEGVLREAIDLLTDHPPRKEEAGKRPSADGGQFVLELSGDPKSALYQVL